MNMIVRLCESLSLIVFVGVSSGALEVAFFFFFFFFAAFTYEYLLNK